MRAKKQSVTALKNVRRQVADVRQRAAEMEMRAAQRELRKAWKALNNDTSHLARAMDAVDRALAALRHDNREKP